MVLDQAIERRGLGIPWPIDSLGQALHKGSNCPAAPAANKMLSGTKDKVHLTLVFIVLAVCDAFLIMQIIYMRNLPSSFEGPSGNVIDIELTVPNPDHYGFLFITIAATFCCGLLLFKAWKSQIGGKN